MADLDDFTKGRLGAGNGGYWSTVGEAMSRPGFKPGGPTDNSQNFPRVSKRQLRKQRKAAQAAAKQQKKAAKAAKQTAKLDKQNATRAVHAKRPASNTFAPASQSANRNLSAKPAANAGSPSGDPGAWALWAGLFGLGLIGMAIEKMHGWLEMLFVSSSGASSSTPATAIICLAFGSLLGLAVIVRRAMTDRPTPPAVEKTIYGVAAISWGMIGLAFFST